MFIYPRPRSRRRPRRGTGWARPRPNRRAGGDCWLRPAEQPRLPMRPLRLLMVPGSPCPLGSLRGRPASTLVDLEYCEKKIF